MSNMGWWWHTHVWGMDRVCIGYGTGYGTKSMTFPDCQKVWLSTAAPSSRGTGTGSHSKSIVMNHGKSRMIGGMDRGVWIACGPGPLIHTFYFDVRFIYIYIVWYIYIYIHNDIMAFPDYQKVWLSAAAAPSSRGTGTGSQSKNIVMHHGISKMIAGMDRGPRRGFMGQALEGDHTHTHIYIYIYICIYVSLRVNNRIWVAPRWSVVWIGNTYARSLPRTPLKG